MARREVVEINCDRCKKIETQNKTEVRQGEEPELFVKFILGSEPLVYEDLCRRCRATVLHLIERISLVRADEEVKEGPKPTGGRVF